MRWLGNVQGMNEAVSLAGNIDDVTHSVRAVPERYVQGPALHISTAEWDALQIPVSIAFFIVNSGSQRTIAFYPGPAGPTESALPLAAWHDVASTNAWIRTLIPDVEALLVRKGPGDSAADCFIVPIDACYDLVGRIRLQWSGFSGGEQVRVEIDRFFADISARSLGGNVGVASRS